MGRQCAWLAPAMAHLILSLDALATPLVSAPPATTPPVPMLAFKGQDRFDDPRTIEELDQLESEVIAVAQRVRQSVVYLKTAGGGATGTAVIIRSDGLLATCGHVGRRPGRELTAILADGTEIPGRTLGQDWGDGVDCGLAQLDTGGRELPAVPLGTTEGLESGDWVVALGYTQGLQEAVRPSLLRAGRVLLVNEKELYFDAPIDAGDSGGPSFNLFGEVVGLNSRCGRQSWQNVATRIDLLRDRMDALTEQVAPSDDPSAGEDPPSRRMVGLRFPSGHQGGRDAVERSAPLASVATSALAATVRVLCDGRPVAFGTVIDADGLIVTKASQLVANKPLTVRIPGDERLPAREIARDSALDVALLRCELQPANRAANALGTIQWASERSIAPGTILITPRGFDRGVTYGFAAIEERESQVDLVDGPYLGVQTRAARPAELELAGADRAVVIIRVLPETAAERAGLKPGQMVLAIDDVEVGTPAELRTTLRKHPSGQSVRIKRAIGQAASEVDVVLGRRQDSERGVRRGNTSTPISLRSSGFGSLLPHDTVTTPDEMGGPLIDLDGNVVGMNIARFDRTATHAIGAERMIDVCARLREMAGQAAQPDPTSATAK
jgi:serine protease Do